MARGYRGPKKRKPTKPVSKRDGNKKPALKSRDKVIVNGHSESWLQRGFCWVYPDEVEAKPKGLRGGEVVQLAGRDGKPLGAGVWDPGWIAVRRFRSDAGPVDEALLRARLERARTLRDRVLPPDTTAWRLVNAESDGLPGIRVDIYGWYVVISLDAPSLIALLDTLVSLIEELFSPRGITLAWRPDHRDSFDLADAPRAAGLLAGRPPNADIPVTERGVTCLVRPGSGKDIGIYPDQRDNRAWLDPHWGGRRVLNLFAHTGFFSVFAALGGATEVVSVDLSEHYLTRAEENFRANNLDPGEHLFIAGDVRKVMDRFRRTGEQFDAVLLDPPAFSRGPEGAMSAKQHYPGMVASALRVMSPEGLLICALNLGEVNPRDFHRAVRDGARKAGRGLQLLHEGGQAPDFPADVDFPEGRYLKFGVWRVL